MAIGTPTQDDHTVRLHRLVCCIATKGAALAKKLKYGTASECDITKFETLVAMQRSLQCFIPDDTVVGETCTEETLATVTFEFSTDDVSSGTDISFSINGVSVYSNNYGGGAANLNTLYSDLRTALLALGYGISLTIDGKIYTIIITMPTGSGDTYNDDVATLIISGGTGSYSQDAFIRGGVDEVCTDILYDVDDNCLTQEDVDLMWEYVSKECDICFAPYGSDYEDPRE